MKKCRLRLPIEHLNFFSPNAFVDASATYSTVFTLCEAVSHFHDSLSQEMVSHISLFCSFVELVVPGELRTALLSILSVTAGMCFRIPKSLTKLTVNPQQMFELLILQNVYILAISSIIVLLSKIKCSTSDASI
jgi:hypothetical protein